MKKVPAGAAALALLFFTGWIASDYYFNDSNRINRIRAHHLLRRELWSIGLAEGDEPFRLSAPDKPILRARDITDTAARMVADPFAVKHSGEWFLFFEIDSVSTQQGEIGLASGKRPDELTYRGIVLDEPFHLSYPCVFKWQKQWYMIPETHQANVIRLYRADSFPTGWTAEVDLLAGNYQDPTPFRFKNRWWMFATTGQNENLHLFYADELAGPWTSHPQNPVIRNDRRRARCGGKPREVDGRLIRFAQDCQERYGHRVLAFEITRLTPTDYAEKPLPENPILEPDGSGWNANRMHQLDLHRTETGKWIGFTDGNRY